MSTPPSVTSPWNGFDGHERTVVAEDSMTGARMVIALHSTVLGPAMGGVRMSSYAHEDDPEAAAYADALRLSRAMTYKNSLAGLDHGGGKGVIVCDSNLAQPMRNQVLASFARLVRSLEGAYVTAGDVGVQVADMDVIGETCRWTVGRSVDRGGVGDSAILTARGVFVGMQAAAAYTWGSDDLAGRTVGLVGVGKVGGRLALHLAEAGARPIVFDVSDAAISAIRSALPDVEVAPSLDDLLARDLDILSPNALGGLVTHDVARGIHARLVCGAANNQLASPAVADTLAERGIVYAPDFVVNCGGVIQIAEELSGLDMDRAQARTEAVGGTVARVLSRAQEASVTPVVAAEWEAEDRIRAAQTT